MPCVNGIIYDPGTDPFNGYLCWDRGVVTEVGTGSPPIKPTASGIITPMFINGHVHIGDSCFHGQVDPSLGLERIVVPPYGLKHQLLATTPRHVLIRGIRSSLRSMVASGTGSFIDFREGGLDGIEILEEAQIATISTGPESFIFSRPRMNSYNREEMTLLLDRSTGIGISAMADWDYSELQKVAVETRAAGKLFALHASEGIREDIDSILDLRPDILIHLTSATTSDLERVSDAGTKVVICPKTNALFGLWPDIPTMLELEIELSLGTDNLMFTGPDLFEEMRFTLDKLSQLSNGVSSCGKSYLTNEILKMAGSCLRKPLNVKSGLHEGEKARFMVLPDDRAGNKSVAGKIIHGGSKPLMVVQH